MEVWFQKTSMLVAIGLRNGARPVHAIFYTGYLERRTVVPLLERPMPRVPEHFAKSA